MARFVFRLLTPHLFFFAVMLYLIDLRPIAVALAIAGAASYFIAEELSPSD
jgi:hypothetical protein